MKKSILILAALAFTFSLGLTGCNASVEDACENLAEVMDKDKGDEEGKEECIEELTEAKEECEEGDEFINCLAEVEDEKGMIACFAHCAPEE